MQSPRIILTNTHDPVTTITHGKKYLEEQLKKAEEKIIEAADETVKAMLKSFVERPTITQTDSIIKFQIKVRAHLLNQVRSLKAAIAILEITTEEKNDETSKNLKNYIKLVLLNVVHTLEKNLEKCGLKIQEITTFKDFLNGILTSSN